MPFDSESESACYGDSVNNVTLCAYRPALESKLSSISSTVNVGGAVNGSSNSPAVAARVAVQVSRVCLTYGRRRTSVKPVLNSISLNVPEAAM